jgi:hypothetical protein
LRIKADPEAAQPEEKEKRQQMEVLAGLRQHAPAVYDGWKSPKK